GIASSLPIVVGGSGVLANLMNRYAWIVWFGGGILGYVAGDMIVGDPLVSSRLGTLAHVVEYGVPLAIGVVVTVLGWWFARPTGYAATSRHGAVEQDRHAMPRRRRSS